MSELRQYQRDAGNAYWRETHEEKQRVLLVLPTGCHAARQGIMLATGETRAVEEIRVGDKLMGPDSLPRAVLSLIRGRGELRAIVPKKGAPWIVNLDHVLTLVETASGNTTAGSISDISLRDWYGLTDYARHCRKLFRVPVDFAAKDAALPVHPYLLGVLLGDGCLSNGMSTIANPDPEIHAAVEMLAPLHGVGFSARRYGDRCATIHLTTPPGQANPLTTALRNLGLLVDSGAKLIPYGYRTATRAARLELLAGLLDTDGHLSNNGFDYLSKSEALSHGVAFVARSLGLAAYVRSCEKYCQTGAGGTYYRVSISGELSAIPNRVARKRAAPRRQKKDVLRTGFRVEDAGEGEYFGFTLDGDGRYLLDDFTVTHNSGKTVVAAHIARATVERRSSRVLFLAHTDELILQAEDKISKILGPDVAVSVEKAERKADLDSPVVVASVQSLGRAGRLQRWPREHFGLVVVDEAHRTLGSTYLRIIEHFSDATLLGITATPYRGDKKSLAQVYDRIAYEITYAELVEQGYLAPIRVLQTGVEIDLSGVRSVAGDFNEADLADALRPALRAVAAKVHEHAADRKGLVFLPTIETSQLFAEVAREVGLDAKHVDGGSPDRREIFDWYATPGPKILSNCAVATEGFDQPDIDMVLNLRATRSAVLAAQIPGRGTRIAPGKDHLLLLDVFWRNPATELVTPSMTFAPDKQNADALDAAIAESASTGRSVDLLQVMADFANERKSAREKLLEQLAKSRGDAATIDLFRTPVALAALLGWGDVTDYEPTFGWEYADVTENQLDALETAGVDTTKVRSKGLATRLITAIERRRRDGLARLGDVREAVARGLKTPDEAAAMTAAEADALREQHGWSKYADPINWSEINNKAGFYAAAICPNLLPNGFESNGWWIDPTSRIKVNLSTGRWFNPAKKHNDGLIGLWSLTQSIHVAKAARRLRRFVAMQEQPADAPPVGLLGRTDRGADDRESEEGGM